MEADGPILNRTLLYGSHPCSNADMKVQRDVLDVVEAAVERVAALGYRVERIPLELPDLGMEWLLHMGAQQVCALEWAATESEQAFSWAALHSIAYRPIQYALLGISAPDVPLDQLEPKLVKSFKLTSTLSVEGAVRSWHIATPATTDSSGAMVILAGLPCRHGPRDAAGGRAESNAHISVRRVRPVALAGHALRPIPGRRAAAGPCGRRGL